MAENVSGNYLGGYMVTKYDTGELWSPNLSEVLPWSYPTEPSTSLGVPIHNSHVLGIGEVRITKEQPKYGWICPKCGLVWAPQIDCCNRCQPSVSSMISLISEAKYQRIDNPND